MLISLSSRDSATGLRIGEQWIPVRWGAVAGQDLGAPGAFVDQFIEVISLGGGEFTHGEVVQDGGSGELAQSTGPGAVGVAPGELGQGAAGLDEPGLGAGPDREVRQCLCDVCFPTPTGP